MTQSIPIYQIDAFTDRVFGGNPAAVCPLEAWLSEDVMQAIAAENNLAETAFYVPRGDDFDIRWFTPVTEIALAGHPTLATAYLLFTKLDLSRDAVRFHTKAGDTLDVTRDGDLIVMDFPTLAAAPRNDLGDVAAALRATPLEILAAADGLAVFATEAEVRELVPDMAEVAVLDCRGLIATAPGDACDFVSRFFAPQMGIPEDPVTGSAHCSLVPYWAERLGTAKLHARQISPRGGEIFCKYRGERVQIAGRAAHYMEGMISL
jgi:PhzF family phenazine biosynthesis protein